MSILDQQPALIRTSEQPTAVLRERVPMAKLTEFFGRAFGAAMAAVQAQNASPTGPPFAMYHGMPTDSVDVEAGFPVTPNFSAAGEVISGMLPESDALEAVHKGPYDTLEQTYALILERMSAEGLTPSDTMWEFYMSDPEKEPDPAKWQTRVVWPVI
ncbi:GyrI-like domain-containing protein [Arthrobacter sp. AK01]|uniref:GyrI-like domain-containing protein n=1 Tax=Micrococcaceae TaxID=1268 RepID=UPI001E3004FD|nr:MULTISPECIES: GyrI-like domain-containing protein [Micrococcaceae]MCD4851590.1 GyrI-like domain-containing protein [Arthrobacter sp. AK01]MCP1413812.1 effector-binding domain-containing protein [Paenarthrobacter sp. A20]